jgi:hypothetical protein
MSKLLEEFIRLAVREVHLARVPNQLVTADTEKEERDEDGAMDEFSGVGSIAGYTGPLGADPDSLGRKKNKPRK